MSAGDVRAAEPSSPRSGSAQAVGIRVAMGTGANARSTPTSPRPLPRCWGQAAERAVARLHRHHRLAEGLFDAIVEARAQADNEAWHLLILDELLTDSAPSRVDGATGSSPGSYCVVCWALFIARPTWSYWLNASFEDHAEATYMAFVADHPELESQAFVSEAAAGYGTYASVAEVLRQIGHDERVHEDDSLHAAHQPRPRR